jgi:predicted glycoside hydrolase/deacetylase ChbG (UPF0249 family)
MRQLIVNADDFGLTEAVSRGILDAHREGIVTSATLMANGPAFDTAVSISRGSPGLGIGVHWNLTSGGPVSPAPNVFSLVDQNGGLHSSPGSLPGGILTGRVGLAHVEVELRRQIAKVIRAGIRPTHLDGHKHVHVLPGISDIVIGLAEEFSIPSIRCPYDVVPGPPALPRGGSSRSAKEGLLFPRRFFGRSQTGLLNAARAQEILQSLPHGVSELVCHPGYLDDDLVNAGTRLSAQREVEIRALTAPGVRKFVADRGIRPISYRELETNAPEPTTTQGVKIASARIGHRLLGQEGLHDD